MTQLGSESRPLRVAIIGAGPSGFYVADALFKADINVTVDCFDRLPTPFGLLRGGVAPDHQQMKTVGKYYERVANKNSDRFNFFGNVKIGTDLSIEELQTYYDAIVLTYGAETDKKLWIDGEDLKNSCTATEFVGWYNGHPDYRDNHYDLNQENIAIIGQGNVAIDVTRILAKTSKELSTSDIADHALKALEAGKVKNIHLIGRRGPVQAAFTQLEIKELGELEDCDIIVKKEDLDLSETDLAELDLENNNKARKNIAVLRELAEKQPEGKSKTIHVHFFKSPAAISGSDKVEGLILETNKLEGEAGKQKAVSTGQKETLECGLIFRSVGYKGLALEGVPFDDKKGVIPNEKGRVLENGSPKPGLYTSGWIKRGASGVLGTNKPDGTETVASLLDDLNSLSLCKTPDTSQVITLLEKRNISFISYQDWLKIDEEEVRRGKASGKPREKFTRVNEILEFLTKALA